MKTNKRGVPLDMLSVTDGECSISISTNRHGLSVHVRANSQWYSERFTFAEMSAILQKAVNEKQS